MEHLLNKAVINEDDKVFNKLLPHLKTNEPKRIIDILNNIKTGGESENRPYTSLTRGRTFNVRDHENDANEDCCTVIRNFNKVNLKENGVTDIKNLGSAMRENVYLFFENYVQLICETLQKNYSIWNYDKKKLAICIILFARSSIFSGANTWNVRLEEITEMHLSQIRDCFSSICQFFSYSKPMSSSNSTTGGSLVSQSPLTPISINTNVCLNSQNQDDKVVLANTKRQNMAFHGQGQMIQTTGNFNQLHSGYNYRTDNALVTPLTSTSTNRQPLGKSSVTYVSQADLKKKNSNCSVLELLSRSKTTSYN